MKELFQLSRLCQKSYGLYDVAISANELKVWKSSFCSNYQRHCRIPYCFSRTCVFVAGLHLNVQTDQSPFSSSISGALRVTQVAISHCLDQLQVEPTSFRREIDYSSIEPNWHYGCRMRTEFRNNATTASTTSWSIRSTAQSWQSQRSAARMQIWIIFLCSRLGARLSISRTTSMHSKTRKEVCRTLQVPGLRIIFIHRLNL